ncbi:GNAT family N-acetyltransferase [Jatrophihabitans sp. YIM 134969]
MLRDATVRFEVRRYDDPLVAGLIEILQADFVQRYGGPDAAVVDPDEFAPPRGLFLVLFAGDEPVAMGGFRLLSDPALAVPTAEIKRMWVHPDHRRQGYARAVLARLESDAATAGLQALILNTGREQPEAIELYQSAGYEPVPAFGHYATTPGALFFGRRLT